MNAADVTGGPAPGVGEPGVESPLHDATTTHNDNTIVRITFLKKEKGGSTEQDPPYVSSSYFVPGPSYLACYANF